MRPLFEPGPTIMTKENIAPLRQPSVPEVPSADENTMLTLNVPRAIDLNLVATRREHDLQTTQSRMCYELGGPRIYTYRSLLEVIARHLRRKPLLVPTPFGLWHAFASVAEMLPQPPITRNQVELMQTDSVASPGAPGFADLRISPTSLEDVLPEIVG